MALRRNTAAGPDTASEVVGDAAQGDRLGQFIGRNEFRVDRLPGWIRQDRAEAKHEGKAEQQRHVHEPGKCQDAQCSGGGQDQALGGEQQSTAVHHIGERTRGEAHKKNGQRRCRLHQRDQEGRRSEPRHEPHAPYILEPRPDICRQGREPDRAESSDVQWRPFGWNYLLIGCHTGPP
jgi:hypothetical protein